MNATSYDQQPILDHVEPVLAVTDVAATIRYWQEVLGFPNQWKYGDPTYHGGVSWQNTHLQFTTNPERAKLSAGNYIWIRVKYIANLYEIHKERKADIVEVLQTRPWGMDEYVVKDINGYHIVFSGHANERPKSVGFPENISVVDGRPTAEEFIALHHSVGWTDSINMAHIKDQLAAPVYSVIAVDENNGREVIGCALVISDNANFYYIKDVMIKKEWQGKRVGTAVMKKLVEWIDKNGISKSLVGLYTGENLEPFYGQFGFTRAFGMVKRVN